MKILGVMRAPFLLLVPACLAPAFAIAWARAGSLDTKTSVLVVIAALAAHIAVNALNEYEDFRSGLDFVTRRTPFSGGSGTLVADTTFAPFALYIALVALLITFSIGLYFFWLLGSVLVVPGLLGLAIIIGYTRWINRLPLVCLFAPGIGFGLLMVNLAVLALTGQILPQALWVSLPVTLLVSNLLLVNQLPDIDADRRVGRRHIAIVWGPGPAGIASAVLLGLSYLSVVAGWLMGALPSGALLGMLSLPLALFVAFRVMAFDPLHPEKLVPGMAANVVVTLTTPLLLGIGVML